MTDITSDPGVVAAAVCVEYAPADVTENDTAAAAADESNATLEPNATHENGSGEASAEPSIQKRAMRGASFLFGREAIGSVVRLIGVIITVRMIGPSSYGVFTAAAAYVAVIVTICQMGTEIYLIRLKEEPTDRLNNEIFTLLLCTSLAIAVVGIGLTYVLEPFIRPVGAALPLRVLLICVPINVLWAPAQAHIERRFDYKKMGILELGGDVVLYAFAVPLAILHFGAWALVIGYFAWQTFLLVGSLIMSGLRPRLAWSTRTARDVLRHGTSYSTSMLFVNLVSVVPALVVGTFVGAAGVGFVAFGRNLVNTVGFAKRAAYRLGVVTMSQLNRDDPSKFRQGLERGSFLLTLAMGIPFAFFGLFAHWVIPDLFGHEWAAALPIYCLLALAWVLNSIGQIEASLFYALGRNSTVAFTQFLQVALLTVISIPLVKLWGVNGFGIASVLALVGFIWQDRQMRKLATYSMALTILVSLILAPSMFVPMLAPPLGLVLFAPWVLFLLVKPLRVQVPLLFNQVRTSLRSKKTALA